MYICISTLYNKLLLHPTGVALSFLSHFELKHFFHPVLHNILITAVHRAHDASRVALSRNNVETWYALSSKYISPCKVCLNSAHYHLMLMALGRGGTSACCHSLGYTPTPSSGIFVSQCQSSTVAIFLNKTLGVATTVVTAFASDTSVTGTSILT